MLLVAPKGAVFFLLAEQPLFSRKSGRQSLAATISLPSHNLKGRPMSLQSVTAGHFQIFNWATSPVGHHHNLFWCVEHPQFCDCDKVTKSVSWAAEKAKGVSHTAAVLGKQSQYLQITAMDCFKAVGANLSSCLVSRLFFSFVVCSEMREFFFHLSDGHLRFSQGLLQVGNYPILSPEEVR